MFSSALKSFSSNINSNYSIAATPSSTSGPWKIYDAKKKSTGKAVSVFVFDRRSLDSHGGSLGRSSAASLKRATEEVVERLKKEASSLARLRHPNILELVEPVEDTRNGGLQFATETVTASLSGILQEKDDQERAGGVGGVGGRSSRFVTEDAEGGRRRRELEIDELEIQKGLEQISKALEFLHDNAGLVHGNLTPDAVFSDWKISGLSFCSPPDGSTKASSVIPINLSETLNLDHRLPRSVQMNLDYSSPDFVLDSNLNTSADMFSLGLLIIALYNSPHTSPLQTNSSASTYKRLFASSSSIPSASNGFLSSRAIPKDLTTSVLPRLITRRPAQRMTAKEFQQSAYFDNILISTIRFLDSLPAKTPNEKAQFMRGLSRVLPSFPKSVLEKKVLPALLEEMKDRELLSLILKNVFTIVELLPSGQKPFTEKIIPRLNEIFVPLGNGRDRAPPERDSAKEAGLMVVLEHVGALSKNCSGKEFKDNILPIIHLAIESPTHTLVDAALRSLPIILPVLDFSTIKNELFPVIASVFTKTSSLGIKVRGLEAFTILCGGSNDPASSNDGLDGIHNSSAAKKSSSTALDKYTMQEKILPLIKGIKTKEPAVGIAALNVLRQVGGVADADFVAMDILPVLWNMSFGPLLDLKQFEQFMDLIKSLSSRVEIEQTKKLQELGGINGGQVKANDDFMSFGVSNAFSSATNGGESDDPEIDFERLLKGNAGSNPMSPTNPSNGSGGDWDTGPTQPQTQIQRHVSNTSSTPSFSWSTPSSAATGTGGGSGGSMTVPMRPQQPSSRTVTPDLSRFETLSPTSTQYSHALQPQPPSGFSTPLQPQTPQYQQQQPALNWNTTPSSNPWASNSNKSNSTPVSGMSNSSSLSSMMGQQRPMASNSMSAFSLPPPGQAQAHAGGMGMPRPQMGGANSFSLPPPPAGGMAAFKPPIQAQVGTFGAPQHQQNQGQKKSGLDAWESLL
ncbi:related to bovine rhodopsin kinase and to YGR052w [Rhynchosporium graminicola]|uniref:Related to bovine rhodopsin kinase and to YGR052w n=1 Tax=Rhynchosporium graminicola TaxID=2792576 RepID=A0A1E1LNW3_9HELO|nr:related to bovine rhodopsin kinase and to YGR052w [Rhynchosporium commune]